MKKEKTMKTRATALAPRKRALSHLVAATIMTAGFAFSGQAHAALLADYQFNPTGAASGVGLASNVNGVNGTTASAFSFGAGLTGNSGLTTQGFGNPKESVFARASVVSGSVGTPGTLASAVSGNSYFSFTLSGAAGTKVNLTGISFETSTTYAGNVPSTYTGNYVLQSSIGGFGAAAPNLLTANPTSQGANANTNTWTTASTGLSFTNLTTPTEFRIYLYDNASGNNNSSALRVDNVKLQGNVVATPEPETWAMMGLGMCALAFIGWRRKKGTDSTEMSMPAGLAA